MPATGGMGVRPLPELRGHCQQSDLICNTSADALPPAAWNVRRVAARRHVAAVSTRSLQRRTRPAKLIHSASDGRKSTGKPVAPKECSVSATGPMVSGDDMTVGSRQLLRSVMTLLCCLGGAFIGYAASPANGHIPSLPHIVWLHTLAACLFAGSIPWLIAVYLSPRTRRRFINVELFVALSLFFLLAIRLPYAIQEGKEIRGGFRAKINNRYLVPPYRLEYVPEVPGSE